MSRTEFTKQTMRQALERAEGLCEGLLSTGERCNAALTIGKYHFDHIIPDAIGGDNSLVNCQVLCVVCHADKTTKRDIPIIAKAKRVADRHLGIRKPSRFPGSRNSRWKRKMDGTVVERF
jgi:5-methylcytosine-specific restriction endonuclease McrA